MPDQSITDPVQPIEESSGPDSIRIKPQETRFQLKVDRTMVIIGVIILIVILLFGFFVFAI